MLKREVIKHRKWIASAIIVGAFFGALSMAMEAPPHYVANGLRTADITVDDKIILGSGSAGIYQYAGDPNSHIGAVKGSFAIDTTTPTVWQNTTGSNVWSQIQGGSGGSGALGSGSIAVTVAAATTPVNLSTTGTIDWIVDLAVGTHSTRTLDCLGATASNCHVKRTGFVLPILEWISTQSTVGTGTGLITFTSTAGDDINGSAALNTAQVMTMSTAVANVAGFRILAPSPGGNTQRVLRLWLYQYDSTVVCTAIAADGNAVGSNNTASTGSGSIQNEYVYTFTYALNTAQPLIIVCMLTAPLTGTGTPNMGWGAMTIGPT